MKNKLRLWPLLLILSLLCACGKRPASDAGLPAPELPQSTLYVKRVENLPDDFILGMDVSSVLAEEASGVVYRGFDGKEQDLFRTLAEAGITHVRVRVWNDPFDENGRGYGGGNCDAAAAAEIGRRAAQYGMKLIVDFHYSDFWADPGKQMVPKAWENLSLADKATALYDYTKESLRRMRDAGAEIGMVQLGNETNGSLCGETRWSAITDLMCAGSRAVREICPEAKIAVHFANPENANAYRSYAYELFLAELDYDVFASSYYPFWHGSLENLASVLTEISENYRKQVMVMETSYAYTGEDSDFSANTISDGSAVAKNYPYTVQGQANAVRDVIETVAGVPNGIGVCYWEGAWISVGTESREQNEALWERYGSGWASSFASGYDPDDAGKYCGGCAVDNQALFDPQGKPLESLRLFRLLRDGNELTPTADAIEDTELDLDLAQPVVLPKTVNAIMTDGSRKQIGVEWEIDEAGKLEMQQNGQRRYEIRGHADGMEALCRVSMVGLNYLQNGGFESGDLVPWRATDLGHTEQLWAENKPTDSRTGSWHAHFWSAAKNSVEFRLEQDVTELPEGVYRFTVSIMGGDGGATEIYAYVLRDGEPVGTAPLEITVYNEWHTATVSGVECAEGQVLTVGVYVKCEGAGNGAWGKIDDASLCADGG